MAHERLRSLRRRGVETVILAGADTHGIMRGKRLPIAEPTHAAEHGVALCEVIWALPVDAIPDLETARIVPWHDRTALVLCDFVDRDVPMRRSEVAAQAAAVTDWEIERYLEAL